MPGCTVNGRLVRSIASQRCAHRNRTIRCRITRDVRAGNRRTQFFRLRNHNPRQRIDGTLVVRYRDAVGSSTDVAEVLRCSGVAPRIGVGREWGNSSRDRCDR